MQKKGTGDRLYVIAYTRGIAALFVAWHHFTGVSQYAPLRLWHVPEWIGVEIFMVISGFILPLALWRRYGEQYGKKDFVAYLLARLTRIEPPYIMSIVLVLTMMYAASLTPFYHGPPVQVSWGQILTHLFYLAPVFGYPWLSIVYWYLAYEFVFYIVLGLTFALLARYGAPVLYATTAVVFLLVYAAFGFYDGKVLLFAIGGSLFLHRIGKLSSLWLAVAVLALAVLIAFLEQLSTGITAVYMALWIWFGSGVKWPERVHRPLMFFGNISYSLYLVHIPIGVRVMKLGKHFTSGPWQELAVTLAALAISVIAAYIFYRLFEKPCSDLSQRIKLRKRAALAAVAAGAESPA
jgi:peptidoglycan/LPS O-acetylase OafA/YrhL